MNVYLVLTAGITCYFILPFLLWLIKNEKLKSILTHVFFGLYLCVLLAGVFGRVDISGGLVKVSFDFGGEWAAKTINWSVSNITTFDLLINLFMVIPVGMYIAYLSRRKKMVISLLLFVALGFATGLFIESFQFILPIQRSVQLSDVLLNMASVVIGGLVGVLYLFMANKIIRDKR